MKTTLTLDCLTDDQLAVYVDAFENHHMLELIRDKADEVYKGIQSGDMQIHEAFYALTDYIRLKGG